MTSKNLTTYQRSVLEAVEKLNRNESPSKDHIYVGTPAVTSEIRMELNNDYWMINPEEVESEVKFLSDKGYLCNCLYEGQRSCFITQKGCQAIGKKWSTN